MRRFAPKNKKSSPLKTTIICASLFTVAAGGIIFFMHSRDSANNTDNPFDPPSSEELEAGQNIRDEVESQRPDDSDSPAGGASDDPSNPNNASIFIISAGQHESNIEVRAVVDNITESGGTCTFAFTQNTHVVTKSTEAVPDARNTSCHPLITPASDFPTSGPWNLVITYTSNTTTTSSTPQTLTITRE